MGATELERALTTLGDVLGARGQSFDLAIVGGGGLLLLGLIDRPTLDLDVVAVVTDDGLASSDPLPATLAEAVGDVADLHGLSDNWLNCGPADLLRFGLPDGFNERAVRHVYGALTLRLASRFDQICFKLYAAVDAGPRSKHVADLGRLEPTRDGLVAAAVWSRTHDPSDGFRTMLHSALATLGVDDHGDV
jgi:hypothetical protein